MEQAAGSTALVPFPPPPRGPGICHYRDHWVEQPNPMTINPVPGHSSSSRLPEGLCGGPACQHPASANSTMPACLLAHLDYMCVLLVHVRMHAPRCALPACRNTMPGRQARAVSGLCPRTLIKVASAMSSSLDSASFRLH